MSYVVEIGLDNFLGLCVLSTAVAVLKDSLLFLFKSICTPFRLHFQEIAECNSATETIVESVEVQNIPE